MAQKGILLGDEAAASQEDAERPKLKRKEYE